MSIFNPREDGLISFDKKALATALGFTQKGFNDRMFNFAFKQVWMEAKRLAEVRTADSENQLNATVTDEDFLKSAKSFLK